jgi:tetratricopeptide (TPR) repeat protein
MFGTLHLVPTSALVFRQSSVPTKGASVSTFDMVTSFDDLVARFHRQPVDIQRCLTLAEVGMSCGREADVLALIEPVAQQNKLAASLWQWIGLLHRSIDQHDRALASFDHAAALQPTNPLIQHSLARTTLEAGLPATEAFDRALFFAPTDAAVLLGRAASLFADGDYALALTGLDSVLVNNPNWLAGHQAAARLRWMMGEQADFLRSLDIALQARPRDPALWGAVLALRMQAGQYATVVEQVAHARSAIGDVNSFIAESAASKSELGLIAEADADYAQLDQDDDDGLTCVQRVRHFLRAGRPDMVLDCAERHINGPAASQIWPYLGTAWRLLDDARWAWLEGDPALIATYDIGLPLSSLDDLADTLRSIHNLVHQPLDQTVRGGTQTDGNLFQRLDPSIQRLRSAVLEVVRGYLDKLNPREIGHPTLSHSRKEPIHFQGAWSVRLAAAGFHACHTHPAGWISSAFYVSLPRATSQGGENDGWLELGAPPQELGTGLGPLRSIQPKTGHLVLFPSTMWHRTRPFADGERMTVAFDVAPPKLGSLI